MVSNRECMDRIRDNCLCKSLMLSMLNISITVSIPVYLNGSQHTLMDMNILE